VSAGNTVDGTALVVQGVAADDGLGGEGEVDLRLIVMGTDEGAPHHRSMSWSEDREAEFTG
jgi:hypothetical protein